MHKLLFLLLLAGNRLFPGRLFALFNFSGLELLSARMRFGPGVFSWKSNF
jgi:hypothetical protein